MTDQITGTDIVPMSSITRRNVLRLAGLGALGLAGAALIGCGDDEDSALSTAGGAGELESTQLRIGYLPITDASPLLLAHGKGLYAEEGLDAERPTLFRGWSPLAEAFQAKQVDVVHILMPMAIWLRFSQEFPLKLVAWNHNGGSALTTRFEINSVEELAGKTVAVPFWYSVHNTVLQMLLREAGLTAITQGDADASKGEVKLLVMSPPDMPPALSNDSIQGFIVADPFNAVAEVNNVGKVLRFIPDVWLDHACCVVVMHQDDDAAEAEVGAGRRELDRKGASLRARQSGGGRHDALYQGRGLPAAAAASDRTRADSLRPRRVHRQWRDYPPRLGHGTDRFPTVPLPVLHRGTRASDEADRRRRRQHLPPGHRPGSRPRGTRA